MTLLSGHPDPSEGTLSQTIAGDLRILFAGIGWPRDTPQALECILPQGVEAATLKQIHSARVLEARLGLCGEGDALITDRSRLALCVVTADCVPVVLASPTQVAAVHAGWRGLAQEILPAALRRFDAPAHALTAWIGPAIGRCCYEVSQDVAQQVQDVTPDSVLVPGRRDRPHLDLHAAAISQLQAAGVRIAARHDDCTRCNADSWHSYRRNGPGAGRNLTCIWREDLSEEGRLQD